MRARGDGIVDDPPTRRPSGRGRRVNVDSSHQVDELAIDFVAGEENSDVSLKDRWSIHHEAVRCLSRQRSRDDNFMPRAYDSAALGPSPAVIVEAGEHLSELGRFTFDEGSPELAASVRPRGEVLRGGIPLLRALVAEAELVEVVEQPGLCATNSPHGVAEEHGVRKVAIGCIPHECARDSERPEVIVEVPGRERV
jgi:hypothetical protein